MLLITCTKCKIPQDISQFGKDKYQKSGLNGHCNTCRKVYCERVKDAKREYDKTYYQLHKKKIDKRHNKYKQDLKKKNPTYKIYCNISSAIRNELHKNNSSKNNASCLDFLPYSIQTLREHLEKQFEPWMNWSNYGSLSNKMRTWQIDHIIPRAAFQYKSMDCEEFRECWALENLRPLEAKENVIKGNKIIKNIS